MASNKAFYQWAGLLFIGLLTYGLFEHGDKIWRESGIIRKLVLLSFPPLAVLALLDAFVRSVRMDEDTIHYRSMIGRQTEFHIKDIVHSQVLWDGKLLLKFRSGESLTLFTTDPVIAELKKKLNLRER